MPKTPPREPWHAVRIAPGAVACPAAVAIRSQRYLSAEAPPIPLPECTFKNRCACTYRHLPDRREIQRRASDRGMFDRQVARNRREKRGRRSEDPTQR